MIKKMILMLLVLVGGVVSANAWGYMKLLNSIEGQWNGSSATTYMTKIDENGDGNYFYYILDSKNVSDANGYYYFRFFSTDNSKYVGAHTENFNIIDYTNYGCAESSSSTYSFKLETDKKSKYIISLGYWKDGNDWKWYATATLYNGTADVTFVNSTNMSGTIYAYAFCTGEAHLLGGWPGKAMTNNNDGTWSIANVNLGNNAKVIFNNGSTGEGNQSYTHDLVNGAVYTYESKVDTKTITLSNDFGTFCNDKALYFPAGDVNIRAYKATMQDANTVQMTRVSGIVPAGTGLFLARKDATNNSITLEPAAVACANLTGNLLKQGLGADEDKKIKTEGNTHRYAFVKRSGNYGFAELTGAGTNIDEDKAYLEVVTSQSAPSLGFSMDDDETTAIYSLNADFSQPSMENGQVFDLQGRRVAEPTKGIYIVNGKKVIIK